MPLSNAIECAYCNRRETPLEGVPLMPPGWWCYMSIVHRVTCYARANGEIACPACIEAAAELWPMIDPKPRCQCGATILASILIEQWVCVSVQCEKNRRIQREMAQQ